MAGVEPFRLVPESSGPDRSLFEVRLIVPELKRRLLAIVIVAQDAERSGPQQQMRSRRRIETAPTRGQHSQDVAAGKQNRVAPGVPHSGDDAVGPRGNLGQRFAARHAIAKELPIGPLEAGCLPTCALRICRNPTRSRSGSISARSPKPASSAVRRARCTGLVSTSPIGSLIFASRLPRSRAFCSPAGVNGMSLRPVCWPERLQAVCPCRAR